MNNIHEEIKFIKWMVGYAKGYHLKFKGIINQGKIDIIDYGEDIITLEEFSNCHSMAMSLLIQRAIEGVNSNNRYKILLHFKSILVWDSECGFHIPEIILELRNFKHIDEAKEVALKYIYEQEIK